ncbi:hypothetical protein AB0B57_23865 [Micromonospora sp. NPDC049101]|uniref:hypothetical protein n=1 Tax=Micromonospora sp. NPDC049101 TaxID=3155032 RepID=UPI0033F14180
MAGDGGLRSRPGTAGFGGTRLLAGGVEFTVPAGAARQTSLVLVDPDEGRRLTEVPMPDVRHDGGLLSVVVLGLAPDLVDYHYVQDGRAVLDPYARVLLRSPDGPDGWRCRITPGRAPALPGAGTPVPDGPVATAALSTGGYRALADRIPEFLRDGVRAVVLTGVLAADHHRFAPGAGGLPVGLFAAAGPGDRPDGECRALIRHLRDAGLAVLLDISSAARIAEGDGWFLREALRCWVHDYGVDGLHLPDSVVPAGRERDVAEVVRSDRLLADRMSLGALRDDDGRTGATGPAGDDGDALAERDNRYRR